MSGAATPYVIVDHELSARDAARVGGKALALAELQRAGLDVPPFVAVTTHAYEAFVAAGRLRARILYELDRKAFADMRWEEMWDVALRIRNLFLGTPVPHEVKAALVAVCDERFAGRPTVVRSSAPGEDSPGASFAGLHESYVNVRGGPAIVEHVRLVWASLWSDAALLYRRELGLDPLQSTMAVVVQQLAAGDRSGVAFSAAPDDERAALVEAVHGLNQGLVDGTVEPDRWRLDRERGTILDHHAAERLEMVGPSAGGVRLMPLPPALRERAPLQDAEVPRVYGLARAAARHFGLPQDVEWTLCADDLFALQARPITTLAGSSDGRAAYLSLRRSFDSLTTLRRRIEEELQAMTREADSFDAVDLAALDRHGLVAELERRKAAHDHWVDVYIRDFIPFAHGVRLFGQAYNDAVRPDDPYEFADVLASTPLLSTRRNAALVELAALARAGDQAPLDAALDAFVAEHSDVRGRPGAAAAERRAIAAVVAKLATRPPECAAPRPGRQDLAARFVASHPPDERPHAEALLELGRASWRLRDDDNHYLARIESGLLAALDEAGRRGLDTGGRYAPRRISLPVPVTEAETDERGVTGQQADVEEPAVCGPPGDGATGSGSGTGIGPRGSTAAPAGGARAQVRQLVGAPAGPGLASGPARVIGDPDDLALFEPGEVLVCDAIQPTMTFVVPLAAGIVERRGGMLIHGAIIAREYGLPCVTGVPRVTELVRTGDRITVDGYLGIVIVG